MMAAHFVLLCALISPNAYAVRISVTANAPSLQLPSTLPNVVSMPAPSKAEGAALILGTHLSTLKGLVSHPSRNADRQGVLEDPNVFNFTIIISSVFLVVVAIIGSAAGIVLFLHRLSVKTLCSDEQIDPQFQPEPVRQVGREEKHPGCVRLVQPIDKSATGLNPQSFLSSVYGL